MFDPEQTILLSYKLLQSPWLFDSLGASGDLCRDLVIYTSLFKGPQVELHLPGFCKAMGYERANLLRPCTPAQVEQIRKTGWKPELIPAFSNVLGLALVRLATHLFIFPDDEVEPGHDVVVGSRIVESIDVYKVQKSVATVIKLTLSKDIVEENRKRYQTIYPAEYLSLRTAGGQLRTTGHPDHAARRLYLRLSVKRQYWDFRLGKGTATREDAKDSYLDLVEAAGLRHRNSKGKQYDPEKKIAYELKHLLKRVGAMGSIGLVPKLERNERTGRYEVSWTRVALVKPGPALESQPVDEAPSMVIAAPAATRSKRRSAAAKPARKIKKAAPAPAAPAAPAKVYMTPPAAPVVYKQPTSREQEKLKEELEDRKRSFHRLLKPETVELYNRDYPDEPGKHKQHLDQAQRAVQEVQAKLTEIGSKMS